MEPYSVGDPAKRRVLAIMFLFSLVVAAAFIHDWGDEPAFSPYFPYAASPPCGATVSPLPISRLCRFWQRHDMLMGQARGHYTFLSHIKWTWAIALGYAASFAMHFLVSAELL
jgi:hypothetical protein